MRVICLLTYLLLFQGTNWAQYTSPFNQYTVKTDSMGAYAFIVSGHFHGSSYNQSGFPANTLLANLDWINASDSKMLVCLGDLFMDVGNDIPNYEKALFSKLDLPLINAVGNHDLSGDVYQQHFGETYFSFELGNDIHFVIDTEINDGDLNEDQLSMLRKALDKEFENVFIYAHRTIWKDAYEEMDGLFKDNTQSLTGNNFEDQVLPILKEISEQSEVYWFSGSLGSAPASFFYHETKEVTYIATAIRSLPRDAMLIVNVDVNGEVVFETKTLTKEPVEPLESYTIEYWKGDSGDSSFNWRLVPLYFKNMLTHRYFWYGVGYSVLGFFFLFLIRKWRKSTRTKPLS